jgi:hypothetical protein
MLVLADETRGLKAARPMQRIDETRKITPAGRCQTEAGLERVKPGPIFGWQREIVPLVVHPVPLQLIIHAGGPVISPEVLNLRARSRICLIDALRRLISAQAANEHELLHIRQTISADEALLFFRGNDRQSANPATGIRMPKNVTGCDVGIA